jgi:Ca-activated chloride channel family protein
VTELFSSFDGIHFIRPWWLLAAIPALVLAVFWARRRISASHWENNIDPELLEALLEPGSSSGFRRLAWFVAGALLFAAIGLSGPAWQRLPQPVEQKSDALVIILDLSLSMFAEDEAPSRLVRARQKITDVLRQRDEGFTALVAYAGDAHIVAPLTDDHRTIQNLLAALSPDMMPVLGSNLESALEQARLLFDNATIAQGRTLLVTDEVSDIGAATDFCSRKFPISVLGVGTPSGGAIPLDFVNQPGQVLRTDAGNPVIAKLDENRLSQLASRCSGVYRRLSLGDADIEALLATSLPQDDESEEVDREFDSWADMGYLTLLVLLPVLLLSFRRGAFAVLALMIVPFPAEASFWDDLWQRPDQQAISALEEGDSELAASLFNDPSWQAVAKYRAEDYAGAAEGFARFDDPDANYNLGNALAFKGDYENSLAAYDRTLAQQPDHEDALHNREIVRQLMEQQQQSSESEEDSEGDQGNDPDQSNNPQDGGDPQDSPEQQSGDQNNDQQPPEGESEQQPDESESEDQQAQAEQGDANRDEKQDALEAWLRRVPDDPGGLLRRKFQYETNQRLRQGDYRSRDSEQIW